MQLLAEMRPTPLWRKKTVTHIPQKAGNKKLKRMTNSIATLTTAAIRNQPTGCMKSTLICDAIQFTGAFWDWSRAQRKYAMTIATLLVCALPSFAQVQYLDKNRDVQANADGAWFKSTSEMDEAKVYHVEVCLISSDEVVMTGMYSDASLTTEEGYFEYYFANGTQESKGLYVDGAKYGDWKRWDWEGMEKADRYYPRATSHDYTTTASNTIIFETSGSEALVAR